MLQRMFIVGTPYTRRQIYDALGGGLQSYLPLRDGQIVAAYLTKKLNAQVSEDVLVGKGGSIETAGGLLSRQAEAIPSFERWSSE